ncbi:hypothetical protein SLE2022_171250 [Rubroshorea leprosula]
MQRQSLGSPVSKLHSHGGDDTIVAEDPRRRVAEDDDDDGEHKATKPCRLSFSPSSSPLSPSASRPRKFIHLIPILTLLCFLILYLSSHAPSQLDLAQFQHSFKQLDSTDEINDAGGFVELRKGDILAIRSLRNLRVLEKQTPKSRPHRKIVDL